MSKPVKAMITAELRGRYEGVDSACVVDLTGLDVHSQESLRRALRAKSSRVEVVRNSLARTAFKDTPLAPLAASFSGPCALVTAGESLTDVAKVLVECAKEFDQLTLKDAIIEGDPGLVTVVELSKMKGRTELLGDVAMLVASPGRAIAGCLGSPQSRIAGCLKAIVDKAA